MFKNFIDNIHKLGRFSPGDVTLLTDRLKENFFQKNHFLLKEGEICQSVYFVNLGSLRQYFIADKGEEIIMNLYVENDWVLDYKSFTSQQPAGSNIQAEEDCHLLQLTVDDMLYLMKVSDSFLQLGKVFQHAINHEDPKSQKKSPGDRYTELLMHKPILLQRFPLKYIASYLGMTPETLNRIRRAI